MPLSPDAAVKHSATVNAVEDVRHHLRAIIEGCERRLAKGRDTDAAREPAFNGCCHKGRCKEGEGGHIDMSGAATLRGGEAFDQHGTLLHVS